MAEPRADPVQTRYSGWSAYISGAFGILAIVFFALFAALELPRIVATGDGSQPFFGTLNDIALIFQVLFMVPVAIALDRLGKPHDRGLSRVAASFGIAAMLAVAILQTLLVTNLLRIEAEFPLVFTALGVVGVWLMMACHVGRVRATLPSRLGWLGIVAGVTMAAGGVIVAASTGLRPLASPPGPSLAGVLALIGGAIGALGLGIAVPIWAIWLGRLFLSDRLAASEDPASRGIA